MVVARCWQQWITEGRVYRRGGQCRLDFCRPRAAWSVTDWRRVIFSDESRFSLSDDDHPHVSGGAPASGPIRHLLSERHTAISQRCHLSARIMLVHTARLSQQCLQGYDVLHGLPGHQIFSPMSMSGRAGRATLQPSRYRRISCADAKTMAGCSTGVKKPQKSIQSEALEEVTLTNSSDIIISGDGTWKTRGYSSRVGVCAVIGDKTGKCIDTEVMSSFCKGCDSWKRRKGSPAYKKGKFFTLKNV
ncbi:uncharacterized protein TNCV_2197931 [Trichonephila clavipes]|nr:uncharacterized protein TNCV_2197931 [Trichonephila clavipes]